MTARDVERDFHATVARTVQLVSEGVDRFLVFTPFRFDDGDHLVIVLKKKVDRWVFSDEAHTYMHLSYTIDTEDLRRGTRHEIISNALSVFGMKDQEGELFVEISDGRYVDALFAFVQGLLRIADVTLLSRRRVLSTFMDDLRSFLSEAVPEERLNFEWSDPEHDPGQKYVVDCRINGASRPLFVHGLASDGRTRDVTISLQQFRYWGLTFDSLAIFEDRESINRKVLARFGDVSGKQFPSLAGNRDQIVGYLEERISGPA